MVVDYSIHDTGSFLLILLIQVCIELFFAFTTNVLYGNANRLNLLISGLIGAEAQLKLSCHYSVYQVSLFTCLTSGTVSN